MPTISESIDLFLDDVAVGQSRRTVTTYHRGLRRLLDYLATANIQPEQGVSALVVAHMIECAKWMNGERGLGKASLRTYLAALARFYSFLLRKRLLSVEVADLEDLRVSYRQFRKGATRPLPKLPPEDSVTSLLDAARSRKPEPSGHGDEQRRRELANLRDIALLESLKCSGMRVGELVGLKRGDINYHSRSAIVTGKGNKQRLVYFDAAAMKAIRVYLAERRDGASGKMLESLPLFSQHARRAGKAVLPITPDTVRRAFLTLREGIDTGGAPLTPHSLRHAFATRVLDATDDLAAVQDLLGHTSSDTTRIYAKVSNRKLRAAHRAAFGE